MEDKCKAELRIADDEGDNYATMICQLKKGHVGHHLEQYNDVTVLWRKDRRMATSPDNRTEKHD